MKVLSQPDINSWKHKLSCEICTAKLEIDANDLKYRIDKRWYDGSDGDSGYYADWDLFFVECPLCHKEVPIMQVANIPYLLKEKIKGQSK